MRRTAADRFSSRSPMAVHCFHAPVIVRWGESDLEELEVVNLLVRRVQLSDAFWHVEIFPTVPLRPGRLVTGELRGGACAGSQSPECGRSNQSRAGREEGIKILAKKLMHRQVLKKEQREGCKHLSEKKIVNFLKRCRSFSF